MQFTVAGKCAGVCLICFDYWVDLMLLGHMVAAFYCYNEQIVDLWNMFFFF